ncbi:MAG: MOSC domain-containing protein [Opitutaceae bacterium]
MALIETALTPDTLVLSSPGHGSVSVPLAQNLKPQACETRSVVIWKDTVTADDCGDESAAWLSDFLGLPCRLVHTGATYARPVPAHKVPSTFDLRLSAGHEVSFADGFPFLVIAEESLADLNARLAAPLPMNRFRPNLVVAGGAPYAEDSWGRFRIGGLVFHGATRCGRCVVTTTDPLTAERAQEPLRTLVTYRRDAEGSVMFGRNLIHETKTGRLTAGDTVELL